LFLGNGIQLHIEVDYRNKIVWQEMYADVASEKIIQIGLNLRQLWQK